jgi:hypothetical protein
MQLTGDEPRGGESFEKLAATVKPRVAGAAQHAADQDTKSPKMAAVIRAGFEVGSACSCSVRATRRVPVLT